jgi:hypothetical protein
MHIRATAGTAGPDPAVLLPDLEEVGGDRVSPLDSPVRLVRSKAGRPLMLVWREDGQVRTRTVLDVSGLLIAAPAAVGALALIRSVTARLTPVRTRIDMGPGGWVSFKDLPAGDPGQRSPRRVVGLRRGPTRQTAGQSPDKRPWWARVLKAERFS